MSDVAPEGRQLFNGKPRPRKRNRNARVPDRYQQLIDGVITVDDLDDEEIARGQLRDVNGRFTGGTPRAIPWVMHDALRGAMERRMQRQLMAKMPEVTEQLLKVATDPRTNSVARIQAAQLVYERAFGKVPDKSEVKVEVTAKWEQAAKGGRIFVDLETEETETEEHDIVEAELVDEQQVQIASAAKKSRPPTGIKL